MMKKIILAIIVLLSLAAILNKSDAEYKSEVKDKIWTFIREQYMAKENVKSSEVFPNMLVSVIGKTMVDNLVDVDIHNYVLFSTAYITNLLTGEKVMASVSVYGKSIFFVDSCDGLKSRNNKDKTEKESEEAGLLNESDN